MTELYLVTDRERLSMSQFENAIVQAVRAGVSIVQLREKNASAREIIAVGKRVKEILAPYNVPLIINDRVDIAFEIGADGVHIGQSDVSVETARAILGRDAIIGLTIDTIEEAIYGDTLDVDYIGVGPIFHTDTKENPAPVWGVEKLKKLAHLNKKLYAIGGINETNIRSVVDAGIVDGIAVVSAICYADDPYEATQKLLNLMK